MKGGISIVLLFSTNLNDIVRDLYNEALNNRHISSEVYKRYETRIRDYCSQELYDDIIFFLSHTTTNNEDDYQNEFVKLLLYDDVHLVHNNRELACSVLEVVYCLISECYSHKFSVVTQVLDILKGDGDIECELRRTYHEFTKGV